MTHVELVHMVQIHNRLTKGGVNAFIGRQGDHIKVCHPPRQEDKRLIIPHAYPKANITLMHALITGKFSQCVFNLTEVGCSPSEVARTKK
jgi:hypothetical protein